MEEHPVQQPIRAIDIDTIPDVRSSYIVGRNGVTRIEACQKADIPYVRVWKGEVCDAEFCQHNILGVYFEDQPMPTNQDQPMSEVTVTQADFDMLREIKSDHRLSWEKRACLSRVLTRLSAQQADSAMGEENAKLRKYAALSERKRWTMGYSDGVPGTPEYEPSPLICKWCENIASRCTCTAALSPPAPTDVSVEAAYWSGHDEGATTMALAHAAAPPPAMPSRERERVRRACDSLEARLMGEDVSIVLRAARALLTDARGEEGGAR